MSILRFIEQADKRTEILARPEEDGYENLMGKTFPPVFTLCYDPSYQGLSIYSAPIRLFTLDEDDLKYLYNKYSNKLDQERKSEIARINKKYARSNT